MAFHPVCSCPDFDTVRGKLWRKRVGHQCVPGAITEPESLPTSPRHRYHGALPGSEIKAKRNCLRPSVRMKDKIVHRAALKEYVGVVRRKPMEIVDGPVRREHVVILALHRQRTAVHSNSLRRPSDNSEVTRFSGQDFKVQ